MLANKKYFTTDFQIYRPSGSIDANNFEIETDVLYLSNKGFFEPLTGAEIYTNDKYEARTTHRLFTYILDIVEKDVITIGSNTYNIDLVQNFLNDHLEIILILRK